MSKRDEFTKKLDELTVDQLDDLYSQAKKAQSLAESKAVEVNAPENWEAYKKATQLADVISKWKNRVTRIDKNEPNLKKKL